MSNFLYCKTNSFIGFPKFIRSLGGSPEALFTKAELDMSLIKKGDSFYDWNKACALLELAARELSEPALGIKWASALSTNFLNSGPMLMLAALTPTIREFAELGISYQKIHINGVRYQYSINAEASELKYEIEVHPLSSPCRQFIEHIMAHCFRMERHHLAAAKFTKLTFQHSAPEDMTWYENTFQCPIEFNAAKTIAYLHSDILDVRLGGKFKSLQPIVKMYLDQKVQRHKQYEESISHSIEQILPSILGLRKSSQIDVADMLGVSPKKLQRLLKDEGVTYSHILDNVRKAMTKRLLMESDISITHLAALLDYASHEAFNTACKRWYKVSPKYYRNMLRSKADEA